MFSIIQKNIDLYSEFYVHILCGFLVMLNYDEMNYNLVSRFFYNVFKSANSGYM
jgi:hypothetical protein